MLMIAMLESDVKKVTRLDSVAGWMLKECAELAGPLYCKKNFLSEGQVIKDWNSNISYITPVYSDGDQMD